MRTLKGKISDLLDSEPNLLELRYIMAYGNGQGNVCQEWPEYRILYLKCLVEIGPKNNSCVVF